jgi:hypothetical protein
MRSFAEYGTIVVDYDHMYITQVPLPFLNGDAGLEPIGVGAGSVPVVPT